jgi:hypothetical protein
VLSLYIGHLKARALATSFFTLLVDTRLEAAIQCCDLCVTGGQQLSCIQAADTTGLTVDPLVYISHLETTSQRKLTQFKFGKPPQIIVPAALPSD